MALAVDNLRSFWKPTAVVAAIVFMYSGVLWKLCIDWWSDDNYSHGLIVPFVIAFIIWHGWNGLKQSVGRPEDAGGVTFIAAATVLLIGGTLASVLFAQRISLVLMIAGIVLFFFGKETLKRLGVPFLLLILSIPLPLLVFNKIAFPLQLFASKIAVFFIELLGIPADRSGNVIEITHLASGELISLEVVEACSGIRSLMTLVTLALILGYFTKGNAPRSSALPDVGWSASDAIRTAALMAAALPVALITNAARVVGTGVIASQYGQSAVDGIWHDLSGTFVFLTALVLLFGINQLLWKVMQLRRANGPEGHRMEFAFDRADGSFSVSGRRLAAVMGAVLLCGLFVNWLQHRGEVPVHRRPLNELPVFLGPWEKRNPDIRFDEESEKVLRANDYVMRDYYGPGKRLNVYVGFYASQRGGATYHSPLSCLPGTGWEMSEPELLNVSTPSGREFRVNRYIVTRGEHREFLIYWYQGRGRVSTNEYVDKLYTSLDSVARRRSDGGMVRIMTPLGKDPQHSLAAAVDLTGHLADNLSAFLPD